MMISVIYAIIQQFVNVCEFIDAVKLTLGTGNVKVEYCELICESLQWTQYLCALIDLMNRNR